MKVRRVKISALTPDPRNARKHGDRNLGAIAASLERFGQVEPLIVQKSSGRVIGGNGRLAAMKASGQTHAEIVELDIDDARAKALGLALNRSAELAEWDDPVLKEILAELEDDALAATGFDPDDLRAIADRVEKMAGPPESVAARVGLTYQEQHGVIVLCKGEAEQKRVYEELEKAGYTCRVVST